MAYGDIFYDNERDEEALKVYQEAMTYYERGLKLLNEVGYKSLRNYPESVRNMNIIQSRFN